MSITVKPKVGHIKVKNSIQVLMHVEHITNEIHKQIIEYFPNHQALKNDLEFIESILRTVIDVLKNTKSNADEKTIIINVFTKLFLMTEVDKATLLAHVNYLLSNKIVKPKALLRRAYSSFKKFLISNLLSKK
jgi:hypothetical protein